jgi:hypothetical protein
MAALAGIRPSVTVEVVAHSRDLNPRWSRDSSSAGPMRLDQIDELLPSGFPGDLRPAKCRWGRRRDDHMVSPQRR